MVKRCTATVDWDSLLALVLRPPVWPPEDGWHLACPTPLPADWDVLCWWCRDRHPASEVDSCMALPRKVALPSGEGSSTSSCSPGMAFEMLPNVWEFLTAISFADGTKRKTGRLSLSFASQTLTVTLVDEETGQYAALSGSCLDDLAQLIEARLAKDELPWRASKWAPQGKRKN